jgi:hypothetical protein
MKSVAKFRAWAILLLVVGLISVASSASASTSATPSRSFKSCVDLKKTYPSGVALNRISIGKMIIDIRPQVYKANKQLDIDKDGIACENEAQQQVLSSTTTSTTPTAPAAPTGLAFTVKTPFDDTGTISWLDNSNNEEYFYISNIDPAKLGATPLTSLFGKKASNSTSAGVWKFVSGVTYCYWVMASNSFGNSAWVGPVCSNPALTSTTTTAYVPPVTAYVPPVTAYVPPVTAYVPPTVPYVPSFGGGSSSSSNWLGCYFKGQRMWGNVYISSSSWNADFSVYITSSSWNADLKVYQPTSSWSATSCGLWYITTSSWNADFTVYLTSSSWNADFSINLTSSSWNAGR